MFNYRKLCLVRDGKFYGVIGTPTGELTMDGQELCVGDCVEFGFEDMHDLQRGLITEVNGCFRIDGNGRCCIRDDKEKVLEKILDGSKTMIVRGAAGRKVPHSRVFEGETLYFIKKGTKNISTMAAVASVQNYVKLTENEIFKILDDNQSKLNLSIKQKERWHKKCLCLVEFKDVKKIAPLEFDHQNNMDDWLIIEKIEDVVVGTSIPYNYDNSKF